MKKSMSGWHLSTLVAGRLRWDEQTHSNRELVPKSPYLGVKKPKAGVSFRDGTVVRSEVYKGSRPHFFT